MRPRLVNRAVLRAAGVLTLAVGHEAAACAVCFGDPHSDMARSAVRAVLFMVAVTGAMLVSIAAVAITWSRRARRLAGEAEDTP